MMDSTTSILVIATFVVFGSLAFLLWLFAVIDCLRSDFRRGEDKIAWLVVVILLPLIGTGLYFIFGRRRHLGPHTNRQRVVRRPPPLPR